MSKEDLVYKILDEQAVQSKEVPRLKKRRRIAKTPQAQPDVPQSKKSEENIVQENRPETSPEKAPVQQPSKAEDGQVKRKRGRPRKNPPVDAEPSAAAAPVVEEKKAEPAAHRNSRKRPRSNDAQQTLSVQQPQNTVQENKKSLEPKEERKDENTSPRPAKVEYEGIVEAQGVLEIMPDGYGFLRSSDYNYLNSPDDIYVSQNQIKSYALKTGSTSGTECRLIF